MKLEEAIKTLEDENQEIFDIETGFNKKWKEAYKTVIQVAKNSIPKEKVLEESNNKEFKKIIDRYIRYVNKYNKREKMTPDKAMWNVLDLIVKQNDIIIRLMCCQEGKITK